MLATGKPWPRWVWGTIAAAVGVVLLYALQNVLTPVILAFGMAYILSPVIRWMQGRGVPRAAGIAIVLTVFLGGGALFVVLVVPGIIRDVGAFIADLPAELEALMVRIEPTLARWGVQVPHSFTEAVSSFNVEMRDVGERLVAPVGTVLTTVLGGTYSILSWVAGALIVPVFAFYMLYSFEEILATTKELVPPRHRAAVYEIGREIDEVLGQFLRGQVIVMGIFALLYGIAYSALGVRLAIPIAIIGGLISFVPYVGGAVALGLALLMCFIDWGGWFRVGGVVVAYALIQLLEGFVITPAIVGEKVGLSSLWVIFALMVGGELFGFVGILLAVPAAAVAKIFIVRAVARYRRSSVYRDLDAVIVAVDGGTKSE